MPVYSFVKNSSFSISGVDTLSIFLVTKLARYVIIHMLPMRHAVDSSFFIIITISFQDTKHNKNHQNGDYYIAYVSASFGSKGEKQAAL